MQKVKKIILLTGLCFVLLFAGTSCVVFTKHSTTRHDNGNHKGWYKNTNNPHNPNSSNPGKSKGKSGK